MLKVGVNLASNLSLLFQDMCASSSPLWWGQHGIPNEGNLKGMQCAVRNTRETAGYDWTRKGSLIFSHLLNVISVVKILRDNVSKFSLGWIK